MLWCWKYVPQTRTVLEDREGHEMHSRCSNAAQQHCSASHKCEAVKQHTRHLVSRKLPVSSSETVDDGKYQEMLVVTDVRTCMVVKVTLTAYCLAACLPRPRGASLTSTAFWHTPHRPPAACRNRDGHPHLDRHRLQQ